MNDGPLGLDLAICLEGVPASQHLVEDDPKGPDVGLGADFLPANLLGAHIADRPQ